MRGPIDIEQALDELIGKSLWGFARATNMAMFQFGERRMGTASSGKQVEVGEFALHVQCRWRIATEDRVLVGSRDINYPADYVDGDQVPDEFDWDRDRSLLDRLAMDLFQSDAQKLVVRQIRVGRAGDFSLMIGESTYLDVFSDESLPTENWRLLKPRNDQHHFVVTGLGPQPELG